MKKLAGPLKVGISILAIAYASGPFAQSVTLTDLTIESVAADTTGVNKFVKVLPAHEECYAVGLSTMLFNDTGENARLAFGAILTAFAAGTKIEVTHDGTGYCKILRVKILK
jgi:hypothetical protein